MYGKYYREVKIKSSYIGNQPKVSDEIPFNSGFGFISVSYQKMGSSETVLSSI